MFFFQRASPPWCYLHVNIFLPSSIILPQTLWGTVQYLQTMLILFKMNHLRYRKWEANNAESKGGKKQGRSCGFASTGFVLIQYPCCMNFSICFCQIRYLKPQSRPKLILYCVLTWQANLCSISQSPPKPRSVTQKDGHTKLRLLAKGATQASQQSQPQYPSTKELCFHKNKVLPTT